MNTAYQESVRESFVSSWNGIQQEVGKWAIDKGWWEDRDALQSLADQHGLGDVARNALNGQLHALFHSEISESLEWARKGENTPDDKIPDFTGEEAELADVAIRMMDYAEKRGLRLAEAIIAKIAFNHTRPKKHGKKF